ncbi:MULTISPECIES: hypothetical protein [Kordiimonas]|uniref:hypothetical protein n=1 Tax=Kordiimonas TaxID=288021 RepID=UPI001FF58215|nr:MULTISPECIES: hypothetical protein [Kordiimonas]MCK0068089.1 hypothetical protein [Kordiimonas laminariae]UTW59938.1 hypothetical protein KFE96_06440 [Kordiimonas sp. SCSIO 12603]
MPSELHREAIIRKIEDPSVLPESSLHFEFADYLASIAEQGMIQRSSFDPSAIPPEILPNLMIWDVFPPEVRTGLSDIDFRFRLMGSGLVSMLGFEMTGKLLTEFPLLVCKEYLRDNALLAEKHSKPVFSHTALEYPDGTFLTTDKAYYPLRHKDGLHGMLVMFTATTLQELYKPVIDLGEPCAVEDRFRVLPGIALWS